MAILRAMIAIAGAIVLAITIAVVVKTGLNSTSVALIGVVATFTAPIIANMVQGDITKKKTKSDFIIGYNTAFGKVFKKYQDSISGDLGIAHLHVLDMSRPLKITDIYVGLRLHKETRPSYEVDPNLREAASGYDPSMILKAIALRLENYVNTAMEPIQAINNYKRCVIVGDPGTGKTTLLKYLTMKLLEKELSPLSCLPIHIELRNFATSGLSDLLEFVASVWEDRYTFSNVPVLNSIKSRLKDGTAILLLDGLDETVIGDTKGKSEEAYRRTANAIIQLTTRYPRSPAIVTTRKASYHLRTPLTGFTELEVLDFRSKDIKRFVNKWFTLDPPDPQKKISANDLNSRLENNLRIQALAANPLLLSLIVIAYRDQLELPDKRAELYRQCVNTMLNKWDERRGIKRHSDFNPEQKLQLLEVVAWRFHLRRQCYFPERELLNVITELFSSVEYSPALAQQILDELTEGSGLFKRQAHSWYSFSHLTLQEYFVAQYAVKYNQLDILLSYRGDPWWEEVILLYAGCISDASSLLQKLIGSINLVPLQEDIFLTNLILAGRCLAAHPSIQQSFLQEEIIIKLFNALQTTHYSLIRQKVAETIIEFCTPNMYKHLIALLSDEQIHPAARASVAEALGKIGDPSIVIDLLPLLSQERIDWAVRTRIADTIGNLGEAYITPMLLELLSKKEINPLVRMSIAEALGSLGEYSLVNEFMKLLAKDEIDTIVRASIARALGKMGGISLSTMLLEKLMDENVIRDRDIRMGIVEALGALGDVAVATRLFELLKKSTDPIFQVGIVETIGKLGERSLVSEMLQMISEERLDFRVQISIIEALGTLGDPSAIPGLRQLLVNKQLSYLMHAYVIVSLGRLGDQSITDELLHLLSSTGSNLSIYKRIPEALHRIGEHSIVDRLLQLLSDSQIDPPRGKCIVTALGLLGETSVVPALLSLLSGQQGPNVRKCIAEALEQLASDEKTVLKLAELLQRTDAIADSIYQTLWSVSRRAGVTVFMEGKMAYNNVKIMRWGKIFEIKDSLISPQIKLPLQSNRKIPTRV